MNFVPMVKEDHLIADFISQSIGMEGTIWMFEFFFDSTTTQKMLQSAVRVYFDNLNNISLSSEVYVLTSFGNNTFQVYEIYKKSPTLNLTVMQLCQITNNMIKYREKNQIWTRRKDLSGVHFRIGSIKNHQLVYRNNEVVIQFLPFEFMIHYYWPQILQFVFVKSL
jgi:hypothetical protein